MDKRQKKKTKNKKYIIIIAIILIISTMFIINILNGKNNKKENEKNAENNITIGLINMSNLENAKINEKRKENISEEILKDREIDTGITMTNIKIYAEDGISNFTADVINKTQNEIEEKIIKIKFLDSSGNLYTEMEVSVPPIKKSGQASINAKTTIDIVNAYNFKVEY